MDRKIIQFPSRPRPGPENVANKARLDAARAGKLRCALADRELFDGADQQRAAQNNHQLLEEYQRERGVPKVQVAREAGLGGDGKTDSTKRLATYTLPENASESRVRSLVKKPGKYFEIADAVGKLASEHPDSVLCCIFLGCSFGTREATTFDREAERWQNLACLIERLVGPVVANSAIADCWHEICLSIGVQN